MPLDSDVESAGACAIATNWLVAFERALGSNDVAALQSLFIEDGHWRDLVAFSWNIETTSGSSDIAARLVERQSDVAACELRLGEGRTPPRWVTRAGQRTLEMLISFRTRHGQASGVVRLVASPPGNEEAENEPGHDRGEQQGAAGAKYRAWIISTALDDLSAHGIHEGQSLPADAFSRDFGGENWLEKRDRKTAFEDRQPAVVVVGAGQAGLGIAARLTALGIDTLLIDAHARIGDNWRKRYHSLTLHNEVHVNHLPFLPFPKTFPVFIPKDKLANWFESYADIMDLSVWTGTKLVGGQYDGRAQTWTLDLEQHADGVCAIRQVRPRHVVFATGVSSIPIMPDVPGLDQFAGTLMHSGEYTDGQQWRGQRALVLGSGNSAHDVAQDLHASGAHVTMVQRSSSYIVSLSEAQKVYAIYNDGSPFEDCDLITTASPYPFLVQAYKLSTAEMRDVDKELHDGLRAAGFKLDFGAPDDTGFQMKYLRRGGGYYFNVGCSDLIASGAVGLVDAFDVATYEAGGARLTDGTLREADLIVAATGYKNQQETVRAYLGSEIADRIGPVWGFDAGGELANMWQRTAQPGLWFTAGSLAQCRIYSKYLALQIAACEAGLIDPVRSLPSNAGA